MHVCMCVSKYRSSRLPVRPVFYHPAVPLLDIYMSVYVGVIPERCYLHVYTRPKGARVRVNPIVSVNPDIRVSERGALYLDTYIELTRSRSLTCMSGLTLTIGLILP